MQLDQSPESQTLSEPLAEQYDPLERRGGDRRTSVEDDRRVNSRGRREPDRIRYRASVRARNLGLICSTIGFAIALYAYLHPTVVKTRSLQCSDGIGGQMVVHDQLSVLWIPAIIISVIGFTLPSARRRHPLTLAIAGAVVGLAIASGSGLRSAVEGFCFV